MWQNYILVVVSVIFNVGAQLLLKKGVQAFDQLEFSVDTIIKLFFGIFTNMYIFTGIFFLMGAP